MHSRHGPDLPFLWMLGNVGKHYLRATWTPNTNTIDISYTSCVTYHILYIYYIHNITYKYIIIYYIGIYRFEYVVTCLDRSSLPRDDSAKISKEMLLKWPWQSQAIGKMGKGGVSMHTCRCLQFIRPQDPQGPDTAFVPLAIAK